MLPLSLTPQRLSCSLHSPSKPFLVCAFTTHHSRGWSPLHSSHRHPCPQLWDLRGPVGAVSSDHQSPWTSNRWRHAVGTVQQMCSKSDALRKCQVQCSCSVYICCKHEAGLPHQTNALDHTWGNIFVWGLPSHHTHIVPQPTKQLSAFSAPFSASIPEEPWLNPFGIGFLSVAYFFGGLNLWPRDRVLVSGRLPEKSWLTVNCGIQWYWISTLHSYFSICER